MKMSHSNSSLNKSGRSMSKYPLKLSNILSKRLIVVFKLMSIHQVHIESERRPDTYYQSDKELKVSL